MKQTKRKTALKDKINNKYQIRYRNKMFGYRAFAILNKKFKTREEAKKWAEKNKTSYIDKIKIEKIK